MALLRNLQETDPVMVGKRLEAIRLSTDFNKTEFAELLGLHQSAYVKITSGERGIQPHTVAIIHKLFGVDWNFVYGGQLSGLPESRSKKIISNLKTETS